MAASRKRAGSRATPAGLASSCEPQNARDASRPGGPPRGAGVQPVRFMARRAQKKNGFAPGLRAKVARGAAVAVCFTHD